MLPLIHIYKQTKTNVRYQLLVTKGKLQSPQLNLMVMNI